MALLLIASYLFFDFLPGGGAILIGNAGYLVNNLVNLFPILVGNAYASLIKNIPYMPEVAGHKHSSFVQDYNMK